MNKKTEVTENTDFVLNKSIVMRFEFSLKINDNIICQRYFNISGYNGDCRESIEMKNVMDDIIGVKPDSQMGIIPEFFKQKCINNSYYLGVDDNPELKDDMFVFEFYENNSHLIRDAEGDFNEDDLHKELIASGGFDGSLFHPNVRYEIDIRSITYNIMRKLQKCASRRSYNKKYGSIRLVRHNKLNRKSRIKLGLY